MSHSAHPPVHRAMRVTLPEKKTQLQLAIDGFNIDAVETLLAAPFPLDSDYLASHADPQAPVIKLAYMLARDGELENKGRWDAVYKTIHLKSSERDKIEADMIFRSSPASSASGSPKWGVLSWGSGARPPAAPTRTVSGPDSREVSERTSLLHEGAAGSRSYPGASSPIARFTVVSTLPGSDALRRLTEPLLGPEREHGK